MDTKHIAFLSLVFLISIQATTAEETINSGAWQGRFEIGVNTTTGNVETDNANLGLNLNRAGQQWRNRIALQGEMANVADEKVAESYLADVQTDYLLANERYWFGYAGYDVNEFANIDYRLVGIAGYGTPLMSAPKQSLDAEFGLGMRQTAYTEAVSTDDEQEAIAHLGLNYSLQITDNTKLLEDLVIQPGSENTYTLSITTLEIAMNDRVAIQLSHTIENNSKVFDGFEKTDTATNASLVIDF